MTELELFRESLRKDGINDVQFLRDVTADDKRQIYIAFQLWKMNNHLAKLVAVTMKP
jgi:hypothetical protein